MRLSKAAQDYIAEAQRAEMHAKAAELLASAARAEGRSEERTRHRAVISGEPPGMTQAQALEVVRQEARAMHVSLAGVDIRFGSTSRGCRGFFFAPHQGNRYWRRAQAGAPRPGIYLALQGTDGRALRSATAWRQAAKRWRAEGKREEEIAVAEQHAETWQTRAKCITEPAERRAQLVTVARHELQHLRDWRNSRRFDQPLTRRRAESRARRAESPAVARARGKE
jgi:hypothetical protein